MRECFVLYRGRSSRKSGRGEVGVFEILGGEGGDVVADMRGDTRDGFLDLSWVVVGLVFVDTGDPSVVSKGREVIRNRDNFCKAERASLRASTRDSRSLYSKKKMKKSVIDEDGRLTLGKLSDIFWGYLAETLSSSLDRLGNTL